MQASRITVSVSIPTMDRIKYLQNILAARLGFTPSITQVLDYLLNEYWAEKEENKDE